MSVILTSPFSAAELVSVGSMANAISGNLDSATFHKVTTLEAGLLGSCVCNGDMAVTIDGHRQAFFRGDALAERQFRNLLGGLLRRDHAQSKRALAYIIMGLSPGIRSARLKETPSFSERFALAACEATSAWGADAFCDHRVGLHGAGIHQRNRKSSKKEIRMEGVNQDTTGIRVPSPDYALVEELSGGMILTNAVHVGLKLGIFDIIGGQSKTCAQIAAGLRLHQRPVSALLSAYTSIGLVKRSAEDVYLLNPEFAASLLSGSPDFIGADLDRFAQLWMRARAGQKEALLELALAYETVGNKYIYGVSAAANIILAQKCGLFDFLATQPQPLTAISSTLGVDLDQAQTIVRTLSALGLISESSQSLYLLAPVSQRFLYKKSPLYYGGVVDLIAAPVNVTTAEDLEESVRENMPIISKRGNIWNEYMDDGEAALFFGNYMFQTSHLPGNAIADRIDFSRSQHLLDVAGGSGAIAISILKNNPHLRATVTDIGPPMLDIAKQKAAEFGVADRLEVIVGDMFTDAFPTGADVIVVSQIIHDWPDHKNKALLRRIYDYLPEGGRVLIHERLLNDERDGPRVTVQQNLFMLLWTEGRQYTQREIETMLSEAGFQSVTVLPTAAGFSVIEAIKTKTPAAYLEAFG